MIDIQFIRDNPELVAEKSKQKGYEVDIDGLLFLDSSRRGLIASLEGLQKERNELSNKSSNPTAEDIEEGRKLKEEISITEDQLKKVTENYFLKLKSVPNMPLDDVPVGTSEDDNVAGELIGEIRDFGFKPKNHWEIAEHRGLIDKERAVKVSGSRFAYLKGDLVKLQFALVQFVINTLTDEDQMKLIIKNANLGDISPKPFIPVLPPLMIKTDVYDAMDRLEPRDDRYKVGEDQDNLWLQGSAEHTLGPMYLNEIIPEDELPIRYLGYATSFRREAGTYGKDTEGIIRMHQFDKLEMESFSNPAQGVSEHYLMVAIQEHLVKELKLPYRVLYKCTADIGKPNARGIDIETWMPGQNTFRETHTADYMTDYQTRRLATRMKKNEDGKTVFVHTNDATAFAMGRIMVAIIENYQNEDGTFGVPEVLRPYLQNKDKI